MVLVRRTLAALLVSTGLGLVSGGCGTFARSYDPAGVDELTIPTPSPAPADFTATVDNPWLPLRSGTTLTYKVTRPTLPDATRTVAVLPGRVDVAGVATTAVRETLGSEVTTDYYAQDTHGNVWWFGHEGAAGGWRAGQGGAQAGLAMAATPRTGDGYRTAYLPGVVEDVATVVEVDGDQVQIDVTSALTPGGVSRETYRRGTGLISRIVATTGEYDELRP
ncbi:hypothetical protein GCM10009798_27440 [Nocardioides panacihumi]|uniref:DUF4136 domain-containing protein n=1 Tax=Nocardioides panacihumi TaxID=400774 RepID=A0ABP5CR74_9ACTN